MNIFKLFKKQEPKVEVEVTVAPQERKIEIPEYILSANMEVFGEYHKSDLVIKRYSQERLCGFGNLIGHTFTFQPANKREHIDKIKSLDIARLAELEGCSEEEVIGSMLFKDCIQVTIDFSDDSYKEFAAKMRSAFTYAENENKHRLAYYEVMFMKRLRDAIVVKNSKQYNRA